MPFVRSISGLRATIDDSLSEKLVSDYVRAFSDFLPDGSVVIGRDSRQSGEWIEDCIIRTLIECGRKAAVLGIVPTPTVQLYAEHTEAVGGHCYYRFP